MLSLTRKTCGLILAALVLAACAEVLGPPTFTETRTFLEAEPEQIRCNLTGQNGHTLSLTTPAYAPSEEFGNWYQMKCFLAGYWSDRIVVRRNTKTDLIEKALSQENIDPRVQNFLSSNPRLEPFPTQLKFHLRRNSFQTEAKRDRYYAGHRARVERFWFDITARVEEVCSTTGNPVGRSKKCQKALNLLKQERLQDLNNLEIERRRSVVP